MHRAPNTGKPAVKSEVRSSGLSLCGNATLSNTASVNIPNPRRRRCLYRHLWPNRTRERLLHTTRDNQPEFTAVSQICHLADPSATFPIGREPLESDSIHCARPLSYAYGGFDEPDQYLVRAGYNPTGEVQSYHFDETVGFDAFMKNQRRVHELRFRRPRRFRANADNAMDSDRQESSSENGDEGGPESSFSSTTNKSYNGMCEGEPGLRPEENSSVKKEKSINFMDFNEMLKKKYGMYMTICDGITTSHPEEDVVASVKMFSRRTEAELLQKTSKPSHIELSNSYIINMAYERHKRKSMDKHMKDMEKERLQKEKQKKREMCDVEVEQFLKKLREAVEKKEEEQSTETIEECSEAFESTEEFVEQPCTSTSAMSATNCSNKIVPNARSYFALTSTRVKKPERSEKKAKTTFEKVRCGAEGCKKNTYSRDKLEHDYLELDTDHGFDLDLEWPGLLLTIHESPITSREISTFLCRESDADEYSRFDKTGNRLIQQVNNFYQKCQEQQNFYNDNHSYSVLIDFNCFPQKLRQRGEEGNQYISPRPCLIDGLGVAYSYDNTFLPKFKGHTDTGAYVSGRVLPVYPLVAISLRLILMGHKVTIILPKYYEVPYFAKQKRLKVDNLYSFHKLIDMKIIEFIDIDETATILEVIQRRSQKTGACILTNHNLEHSYFYRGRQQVPDDEYESFHEKNPKGLMLDRQKIDHAQRQHSDRMLSVQFQTETKELVMLQEYSAFVGIDTQDHEARKHQYIPIGKDVLLFYTDRDGDILDELVRKENQLMFYDQVRLVIQLCDLYNITKYHLRAVQLLLRFAWKWKYYHNIINGFVSEHKPYIEPTNEVLATLAEEFDSDDERTLSFETFSINTTDLSN